MAAEAAATGRATFFFSMTVPKARRPDRQLRRASRASASLAVDRRLVTQPAPASSRGDAGARMSGAGRSACSPRWPWRSRAGSRGRAAYATSSPSRTSPRSPGVTLEGTGFTGREVRESFALAARPHPVEMVFYDNQRDDARALANAEDAIARKVDLYIQYHRGRGQRRRSRRSSRRPASRCSRVNYAGARARRCTPPTTWRRGASRVKRSAQFALRTWRGQPMVGGDRRTRRRPPRSACPSGSRA